MSSPYSLAFCPAPDTLADGLPRAPRPPPGRSRGFSCPRFRYYTVLRPLTGPWCPLRLPAYRRTFPARSLRDRPPMRSPRVTTCSSAPCRPHTPWSEGRMDHAFVARVPTRPDPLFGRPVHRRVAPSITARCFSASPSDSTSRWTPCPPQPRALGPARHYPRFWIWRPPSERQEDFNLPEHVAAWHTLRTLPPPSRLRSLSRLWPVIRSTWLHRFRDGARTVSPVARHALITVLSLPPRRRDLRRRPGCLMSCCLRPGPRDSAFGLYFSRGHWWVHSRHAPVTRSPSRRWLGQVASSASFPPRRQPKLRGS